MKAQVVFRGDSYAVMNEDMTVVIHAFDKFSHSEADTFAFGYNLAAKTARAEAFEEAAELCDEVDKSTAPAELADEIRQLAKGRRS